MGYHFNINGLRRLSAKCSAHGIWTLDGGDVLNTSDAVCESKHYLSIYLLSFVLKVAY